MVQDAGFPAVYMTGAGTAASLGYPDYGLLTMSEMVGNARRIAVAVTVPVIADADTGFGNELNVVRTVHEIRWWTWARRWSAASSCIETARTAALAALLRAAWII